MKDRIGNWYTTIFWRKRSKGIEGDRLVLQQRGGSVKLNALEIQVVVAFAKAVGIEADDELERVIVERLEEVMDVRNGS